MMENKGVTRCIRFSADEDELLITEANLAGLSISEYIRTRIFNDSSGPSKPIMCAEHEKYLMQLVVRMFGMVEKIANKALDQETRKFSESQAATLLKKWGYEE